MRLSAVQIDAIKAAAHEAFGPDAVVRLFGSRVRDDLRGGDIDLHVEVADGSNPLDRAADFKWHLFRRIAEQQVDLVIHAQGAPLRPIDRVAFEEGVVL